MIFFERTELPPLRLLDSMLLHEWLSNVTDVEEDVQTFINKLHREYIVEGPSFIDSVVIEDWIFRQDRTSVELEFFIVEFLHNLDIGCFDAPDDAYI